MVDYIQVGLFFLLCFAIIGYAEQTNAEFVEPDNLVTECNNDYCVTTQQTLTTPYLVNANNLVVEKELEIRKV